MLTSLQCFSDTASGVEDNATIAVHGSSVRLATDHMFASPYVHTLTPVVLSDTGTTVS